MMKVSLGMRLQTSPFGGGNQFGQILSQSLREKGVQVSYDLAVPDLDIILLAEPDASLAISAYTHRQILKYLLTKNRGALVVHRINNTSEARDDAQKEFNRYRIFANRIADHTIFVSQWVQDCYVASGYKSLHASVILNGGDANLWTPKAQTEIPKKLHIVTHHWSKNANKGFDVYQRLDAMLDDPRWSERIEFTYIGRLPEGLAFKNAHYREPLAGETLANELRKHDLYLTASRFEAGPNHVLEGALCGLPLLYIESGAMPEYCAGYGLPFNEENFEGQLATILAEYPHWLAKMPEFPHTAERMCQQYYALFETLLAERETIRKRRRWLWDIPWLWGAAVQKR